MKYSIGAESVTLFLILEMSKAVIIMLLNRLFPEKAKDTVIASLFQVFEIMTACFILSVVFSTSFIMYVAGCALITIGSIQIYKTSKIKRQ